MKRELPCGAGRRIIFIGHLQYKSDEFAHGEANRLTCFFWKTSFSSRAFSWLTLSTSAFHASRRVVMGAWTQLCWSSPSTDREPLGPAGAALEKGSS